MAIFLGALAAIAWGSGDFFGGLASRRADAITVVLTTEVVGLLLLLVLAVPGGGDPSAHDLLFGAGAGIFGVIGLVLLYRGLVVGRASVVAPLSAVGAAVLQVTWGLANGEEPGTVALVGVVVAFVAIGIVAGTAGEGEATHHARRAHELLYGLGAAVGFGLYLILISETGDNVGLWPVVAARVAPIPLIALLLLARRQPLTVPRPVLPLAIGSGLADAGANALLILAIRRGLLTVVAPVANLYPAVTVILAAAVLHERITRARLVGLLFAVASLVLIAL